MINKRQWWSVLLWVIVTAIVTACGGGQLNPDIPTTISTPSMSATPIRVTETMSKEMFDFERALILETEEREGNHFEQIQADVSDQLVIGETEGISVVSGEALEDFAISEMVVFLFAAKPINHLDGYFALSLRPMGTASALHLRSARLRQGDGNFVAEVELQGDTDLDVQWAYTRHPNIRQVTVPLGGDPYFAVEGKQFHQAKLPILKTTNVPLGQEWAIHTFPLDHLLLDQSISIDQCEQLIEAIDAKISTGEFLIWSESSLTQEAIEKILADSEKRLLNDGEKFNVTIEYLGKELVWNKRLQPLVRHAVTIVSTDGERIASRLDCSMSKP